MAKYDITYSCGHGDTIQLYGPHKDRERKIEWLERDGHCPECYKALKRAEAAEQPITAHISLTPDRTEAGHAIIEIALKGGTEARKEEIRGLGYRWAEIRGGVFDMLSVSRPPWAWVRYISWIPGDDAALKGAIEDLQATCLTAEVVSEISPFDIQMLRDREAERVKETERQARIEAAVSAIPKPERPACMASWPSPWTWNGKLYGNPKYGPVRVYIRVNGASDGTEIRLGAEEARQIQDYMAAKAAYNAACEQAKKEE